VLDLDVTETVEASLISTVKKSKRIEESKWLLGTKGILESVQGSGGGSILSWGESGSGGKEGGENGKLHFKIFDMSTIERTATLEKM
jgi:hypothetical protein